MFFFAYIVNRSKVKEEKADERLVLKQYFNGWEELYNFSSSYQPNIRYGIHPPAEFLFFKDILISCVSAKLLQSCPTLYDPMDCSLPDSCVHGDSLFRQENPSGLACPPPEDLPDPNHRLLCFLRWHAGSLPLAPYYPF